MPNRPQVHRPYPGQSPGFDRAAYERSPQRLEDRRFYNSAAWRRCRKAFLTENPLCVDCEKEGHCTPATQVDHIKARKDHPELAFDFDNLRALCLSCHSRRTRQETNRRR